MLTAFTYGAIKVLVLSAAAAVVAFVLARIALTLLYRLQFWKKKARTVAVSGEAAPVFHSLHKDREVTVPRGGGVIIWMTASVLILVTALLAELTDIWWLEQLNVLSRSETWLPLLTLVAASLVGLLDDALTVYGKGRYIGGGMSLVRRLLFVTLLGAVGAWWFFVKLGWDTVHIPLMGDFSLGIIYVVLFIFTMLASWMGGVVDGIDGLAGGVFLAIFGSFTVIAFSQGKVELAAFGGIIMGTLAAFLWFNIPPARFYMGETGIMGLTSTMAVMAFLTDSVVVLPVIAGILVIEVGSVILQTLSKKFRHKKIWLSTPIHHHLEARGWPQHQITMRLWIIAAVLALVGTAIRLMG